MSSSKQFGDSVPDVTAKYPAHVNLDGRHVRLLPMQPDHADRLFKSVGGVEHAALYDYLFYGPFPEIEGFREHIAKFAKSKDPQFYSIEDVKTGDLVGQMSYLRIDAQHRVIEIGHIMYGPALQRTVGATEAFYLLAKHAFDEGYRRLEWKCDSNNKPSWRAALRHGHTFEGIFRQHMIIKQKNRDSVWFSILDQEWPHRMKAFELWLDPANFDENGRQRRDLTVLREGIDKVSRAT